MSLESLVRSAVPQTFSIAAPAAGADLTVTVPVGMRWRVDSMYIQLVTSAVVANRFMRIQYLDAVGNLVWIGGTNNAVPASSFGLFGCSRMGPQLCSGVGTICQMHLPDLWLPAGGIVRTLTTGIDVGDQYAAVKGFAAVSADAAP